MSHDSRELATPRRNGTLCLHLTDCEIGNPATPIKRRISAVACVSISTAAALSLSRPYDVASSDGGDHRLEPNGIIPSATVSALSPFRAKQEQTCRARFRSVRFYTRANHLPSRSEITVMVEPRVCARHNYSRETVGDFIRPRRPRATRTRVPLVNTIGRSINYCIACHSRGFARCGARDEGNEGDFGHSGLEVKSGESGGEAGGKDTLPSFAYRFKSRSPRMNERTSGRVEPPVEWESPTGDHKVHACVPTISFDFLACSLTSSTSSFSSFSTVLPLSPDTKGTRSRLSLDVYTHNASKNYTDTRGTQREMLVVLRAYVDST